MSYTLEELKNEGRKKLSNITDDSDFDSLQLLQYCFDLDSTSYLLHKNQTVDEGKAEVYFSLIDKRASGEPLQYLLKNQVFLDSKFNVGRGVLIPRPETEELTEFCIEKIKDRGYRIVYDLCAGSGCIGISIAKSCLETKVYLFEKYDEASVYLLSNIPESLKDRVRFIKADIFSCDISDLPIPDLIVSNPPYILRDEIADLQKEVRNEPQTALDGGKDGLDFYRCIISDWIPRIRSGGLSAFECGEGQAQLIVDMIHSDKKYILKDIYGAERFVAAEF